uniref:Uncharacterized protein n=1 Tax=Oryctolagus cuniculus TaxID=9986 RepID=A0A5F9CJ62_RABIT
MLHTRVLSKILNDFRGRKIALKTYKLLEKLVIWCKYIRVKYIFKVRMIFTPSISHPRQDLI